MRTAYAANKAVRLTFSGADRDVARGRYALHPTQFRRAVVGDLAAEALEGRDRGDLMCLLVRSGLTDREIELQTGWTLYTVERIRRAQELRANPDYTIIERSA